MNKIDIKKIKGWKIPKEIYNKIKKYSEQIGKDEIELLNELAGYYEEDKATSKRRTEDAYWTKAIRALRRQYRKDHIRSTAITFTGYIFGDSGVNDFVDLMKKKAYRIWATDRSRAINKNYTNDKGEPLDRREQINFEDNPRYLLPFRETDHSWFRDLYGIAGKGNDWKETKFFSIRISGEDARNLDNLLHQGVKFRATIRSDSPEYVLNATSVTKFSILDEIPNPEKLIRNCGKEIYRITELDKIVDMALDESDNPLPVLVEAIVHNINPEPHAKTNNRTIVLDDEDLPMDAQGTFCYMPFHIPLDFKEDDQVIFLAKLSKSNFGGKERVVLNSMGYYSPVQ